MKWKKNPRGTRVFKTRVPPFYFPFLLLPRVYSFFVLRHCWRLWRSDRPPSHWRLDRPPAFFSNQIAYPAPDRLLQRCGSPTRLSSSALHSSLGLFFFKSDENRVSKTQFCFLKLKSYRLKIYVAKLLHDSSKTRVWKPWFSSSISSFKNLWC